MHDLTRFTTPRAQADAAAALARGLVVEVERLAGAIVPAVDDMLSRPPTTAPTEPWFLSERHAAMRTFEREHPRDACFGRYDWDDLARRVERLKDELRLLADAVQAAASEAERGTKRARR